MNKRSVIITLVVSIAAGMLGAQIAVDRALKAFPGPLAGALSGAAKMARKTSDLTATQRTQLALIENRHAVRLLQLRQQVAADTLALAAALRADPHDASALDASRTLATAAGALQEEGVRYLQEVREVLTAQQRTQVDAQMQALLLNTARTT